MLGLRRSASSRQRGAHLTTAGSAGQPASAAMLGSLATAYVAAMNDGAVPSIRKSWAYVVDQVALMHRTNRRLTQLIQCQLH
jgi:hypothetical protein